MVFELWIKRALKAKWGQVAREPVPEDLLSLLDETATAH